MNHLALRASRTIPVGIQLAMAHGALGFYSAHLDPGGRWEIRFHARCPNASVLAAADRHYEELVSNRPLPALAVQVWVVERLLNHPAGQPLLVVAHATC